MSEHDPSVQFFAGLVDHILLVARAGDYDETAGGQFIARLGLAAPKVLGAVLTGATTS